MNLTILNFNSIGDYIFNILVAILKPFVHSVYYTYKILKNGTASKKKLLYKNLLHKAAVVFIVCVLSILIALSVSLFSHDVEAHDNDILHKYYTSVTIQPGDSLWSIANEHYQLGYDNQNEYINEVMQINHITDADALISGTSIVIPYYSEEIK